MNIFFVNMTEGLDLKKDNESWLNYIKYQNINENLQLYPTSSVHKIKQTFITDGKLSFKIITKNIVRKEISQLDSLKASPNSDIPANILKSTVDIYIPYITNITNFSVEEG